MIDPEDAADIKKMAQALIVTLNDCIEHYKGKDPEIDSLSASLDIEPVLEAAFILGAKRMQERAALVAARLSERQNVAEAIKALSINEEG